MKRAPWTDEEVAALNEWQASGKFHPYTCGKCRNRDGLLATNDGWICPTCDYKQDWAHGFSMKKDGMK